MNQAPHSDAQGAPDGQPATQARRLRLREFQTQLIERMRAARSGAAQATSQLGVRIGQHRWLLNLQHAGEVTSVDTISPVPLTQEWFLGLMNLRGNLISVTDLARFQGLPPTTVDRASRIVSFSPSLGLHGALLVSEVLGLRNIDKMTAHPEGAPEGCDWAGMRYFDREAQLWTEMDLSRLARDPRFLDVGR
jgi:twitching motility protein PilI